MSSEHLSFASVTPNSVGGEVHVGAMGWILGVVDRVVVQVVLRAADPPTPGIQTQPQIGTTIITVIALGKFIFLGSHRLDQRHV